MQDDNERRAGHERIPFEALVAVDGDAKAGGYECEAMDVSQTGMHLRTAYLPEIGQELTLRFDAGTGEVAVVGLVVWREEQARGGEFGLEFRAIDDSSLESLKELCGVPEEPGATVESTGENAPGTNQPTARGSRVRLHIEGLGSPMRARVKDSEGTAVMVGSNLDFLRVGRELELEDMEHGDKRAAYIDRVDVEVDPESRVPQLVVTLKYDAKDAGKGTAMLGSAKAAAKEREAEEAAEEHAEESGHEEGGGALDAFRGKASEIASSIGPAMSAFGLRAKSAMASTLSAIKGRKGQADANGESGDEADGEHEPKVTAEAPGGGLSSRGKRGLSAASLDDDYTDEEPLGDDDQADEVRSDAAGKRQKRKILAAGGAAVALLIVLVLTLSGGKKKEEIDPTAAVAASASAELAALAAPAFNPPPSFAPPGAAALAPGADAVTASVPLFGTTPLSTTEPAAATPPVAGVAVVAPGATGALAAAEPAAAPEEAEEKDVGDATYGKGTVKNAKTVRLKMDAPIEGLKGAVAGKTLTITLPGRHNVEAASSLAKKDKRISSSKAVATSDGVDVSLTFKESVPPFLAKTDGKTLAIELGESSSSSKATASNDEGDDEEVAAKPKHKKSKKHATAKKGADKSKKDKKKAKKKKK
jgi:hypothetical protein